MPSARVPPARTERGPGCNCRLVPDHCKTNPFCTGDESNRFASLGMGCRGADAGAHPQCRCGRGERGPDPCARLSPARSQPPCGFCRGEGDSRSRHELAVQREQIMLFIYSVCCLSLMETKE